MKLSRSLKQMITHYLCFLGKMCVRERKKKPVSNVRLNVKGSRKLVLTECCCSVWRFKRLIHIRQKHFQTVEDEATGSDERGGIEAAFTHTAAWRRSRPPLLWEVVYKRLRAVSPLKEKLAGGRWKRGDKPELQAAWLGMTALECAARRCRGAATFTHRRNRSHPRLERAGVERRRLGWRRIVCRLLLTSRNQDELVYNVGRQSLDSVRPRRLLRTGKTFFLTKSLVVLIEYVVFILFWFFFIFVRVWRQIRFSFLRVKQICKSECVITVKRAMEAKSWERARLCVCARNHAGSSCVFGSRPLLVLPPLELDARLAPRRAKRLHQKGIKDMSNVIRLKVAQCVINSIASAIDSHVWRAGFGWKNCTLNSRFTSTLN